MDIQKELKKISQEIEGLLSTAVNPIKEQEFISIMKDHNITPQQFMDNDD